MDNIIKSATKLILLLAVFTLCFLMLYGAVTDKLDYKDITTFAPESIPFKSFPAEYEIVEIFPLLKDTKHNDYCT